MEKLSNDVSNQDHIVTPKTIEIFSDYARALKRIRTPLIAERYAIKDGVLMPPKLYTEEVIPLKMRSRGHRKNTVVE